MSTSDSLSPTPPPSEKSRRTSVYKKIGQYSLLKEIGQGSFARVYKARTEGADSSEDFAIKMVSKSHLRPENQEIIEKEIDILQQLNHPNIIKLRDFKKTSNNWYLVFEYCELGDLEHYIHSQFGGKLPLDIAVVFLHQLAAAYREIRRLNIVHRDLKLANLLLNADLVLKLGDFGFAKHFEQDSLLQSYCGTPITMAPEILKREKYNEKCDIWSIGVILYQMIYGKPPFNPPKGAHLQDLITLIEQGKISFESVQIPLDLQHFITSMLQTNPADRLSFDEFFAHPCIQLEYLATLNNKFALIAETLMATPSGSESLILEEKRTHIVKVIQRHLTEQMNAEISSYIKYICDFRIIASTLSREATAIEFAASCAWSALLLLACKTVKTVESQLEIVINGQIFKCQLPLNVAEQLKVISKKLAEDIRNINLESSRHEQAKHIDVYNMLFGSILSYADHSLLNEYLNPSPQKQLEHFSRCLKLTELLLSIESAVFSRTAVHLKDTTIIITKQDIASIFSPSTFHEDGGEAEQSMTSAQIQKKEAAMKALFSIEKQNIPANILEVLNIVDKTEELKMQHAIYLSRYNACLASIEEP